MEIFYTKKFAREYRGLPPHIKRKAETREALFHKDPHRASLKTHKLKGELDGFWSFSIDFSYRIIFEFRDAGTAVFHSVGDYSIYR